MDNSENNNELSKINNSVEKTNNELKNIQPDEEFLKEKNITEESNKINNEEKENQEDTETTKSKKSTTFIILISLGVLILLGYIFTSLFSSSQNGYETLDANKVIHNQENPPLKADKLDPNKVYVLSGASDTLNQLTVKINKIQFRKDQTRL